MDWIFDNLPIVFFVVISVASFIKSRIEARKAQEEADRMPPVDDQPEEWFGPEDQWQTPNQASPQPPPHPTPPPAPVLVKVKPLVPPPIPAQAVQDAWSPSMDAEIARQQELRDRLQQLREKRAVTTGGAAATKKRITGTGTASSSPGALPSLRRSLRERTHLRRALVTQEILGPPLALKQQASAPNPVQS